MIPKPTVRERPCDMLVYQQALLQGLDPLVARVIASRPCADPQDPKGSIQPRLKDLSPPWDLASLPKACERLVRAIVEQEIIGLETDHDCDGQTAHAVLYTALVRFFGVSETRIRSYIGHRLEEGYGLSQKLARRILADTPRPSLVITADNGSSDEPRIAELADAGIDVIVTDHHEIPEAGIPQSAVAVLNPSQATCGYGDRSIAGCMVAWLLVAAVRHALIEQGYLRKEAPGLASLLDFVAVGTIADCVSMASSVNNRAVVRYGLSLLEKQERPCWRVLRSIMGRPFNCEALAFSVAPLLNSDGRLATAMGSVSFLLSRTEAEALAWLEQLQASNQERKVIQKRLLEQALALASQQYASGRCGLSVFLKEGHSGVHGIVASKLKEAFGLPAVMLTPKAGGVIAGSARGIPGVHVRQAIAWVAERLPEAIVAFGGHQGAAGLTLKEEALSSFQEHFDAAIRVQLGEGSLRGPVLYTDGIVAAQYLTLASVKAFWKALSPFGREFEAPVFEVKAKVLRVQPLGTEGLHYRMELLYDTVLLRCTYFNARAPLPLGAFVRVFCTPKVNVFRGEEKCDLQCVHWEMLEETVCV